MEKKIAVGLAGYGLSGEVFHAPFLMADPRFELKQVWERSTSRSAQRFPSVQVVHRFEDLLESDVQVIVLGVPNHLHVPLAEQAMRAGKHVVVEKPVTATTAEAASLFRTAQETGRLLAVYQNRRWDGPFLTARKLVEEGTLGEIVEWQGRYDRFTPALKTGWREQGTPGVGTLYDLGSHLIDQVVSLFGRPESVWGDLAIRRVGGAIDDDFVVHLFYPQMRATLCATQMAAQPGPHLTVRGTKGSYVEQWLDVQEKALRDHQMPEGRDWGRAPQAEWGCLTTLGEDGALHSRTVETVPGDYRQFFDCLYRAVANGEAFPVQEEQVLTVMQIMEAAEESSRTGQRIVLD